MNPSAIYIGIDLGTSGVRACAIDHSKTIQYICKTALPSPLNSPLNSYLEQTSTITQNPNLWWQATKHVLGELLKQIDPQNVKAICVNGTSGTVLVCDSQGQPLAPALMYNDASCREQAQRIQTIAPPECAAHGASSGLAKLLYLQKQFPHAQHFLHQADWIVGKLCGRFTVSDENNALKTGYDPQQSRWPDWFSQLNIKSTLLPRVVVPGTAISHIRAELFSALNLNPNCQIVSGTTDSIAAFIAAGANKPGDAVSSLGSTLVLKIITERPVAAPEFGIYSHKFGDYWLAGGASNSGGAVLAHYFTAQQINDFTTLLKPEIPTQLNYYPLLDAGERFPVNDPNLSPRLEPKAKTELEFFQGILEGISQIELEGYRKLQQLGAPFPSQVETAGGGSKNALWLQMRQNILGVPVMRAKFSEACYGSALLARQGLNKKN